MVKQCARCKQLFEEDDGFITCPSCRRPLPSSSYTGGCSHWENLSSRLTPSTETIADFGRHKVRRRKKEGGN